MITAMFFQVLALLLWGIETITGKTTVQLIGAESARNKKTADTGNDSSDEETDHEVVELPARPKGAHKHPDESRDLPLANAMVSANLEISGVGPMQRFDLSGNFHLGIFTNQTYKKQYQKD